MKKVSEEDCQVSTVQDVCDPMERVLTHDDAVKLYGLSMT